MSPSGIVKFLHCPRTWSVLPGRPTGWVTAWLGSAAGGVEDSAPICPKPVPDPSVRGPDVASAGKTKMPLEALLGPVHATSGLLPGPRASTVARPFSVFDTQEVAGSIPARPTPVGPWIRSGGSVMTARSDSQLGGELGYRELEAGDVRRLAWVMTVTSSAARSKRSSFPETSRSAWRLRWRATRTSPLRSHATAVPRPGRPMALLGDRAGSPTPRGPGPCATPFAATSQRSWTQKLLALLARYMAGGRGWRTSRCATWMTRSSDA